MELEFPLNDSSWSDAVANEFFDEDMDDKNEEIENEKIEEQIDEEVEEPIPGKIFDSEKQVETYYARYARKKGFAIIKRTSKTDIDGRKYFTIACARSRMLVSQRSKLLKPNPTI